jgi:hypothetical protein
VSGAARSTGIEHKAREPEVAVAKESVGRKDIGLKYWGSRSKQASDQHYLFFIFFAPSKGETIQDTKLPALFKERASTRIEVPASSPSLS